MEHISLNREQTPSTRGCVESQASQRAIMEVGNAGFLGDRLWTGVQLVEESEAF